MQTGILIPLIMADAYYSEDDAVNGDASSDNSEDNAINGSTGTDSFGSDKARANNSGTDNEDDDIDSADANDTDDSSNYNGYPDDTDDQYETSFLSSVVQRCLAQLRLVL